MAPGLPKKVAALLCVAVGCALAPACLATREDAEQVAAARNASGEPLCDCPPLGGVDDRADGDPVRGGTVTIAIDSEPGTLLSMFSADPIAAHIADHDVLEALTVLDPISGEPLPELAARWEAGPGAGEMTFHLVRDARWHDGRSFTAEDVVFTFNQLLDPAGGAVRRVDFLDVRDVSASDSNTVIVRLDRDRPDLPTSLARVPILPKHVFGNEIVATHPSSNAPVGTGPFRFASWKPGVHIELERNPGYRGQAPLVDRVVYRVAEERQAALELFRNGGVDIVPDVGGGRLTAGILSRGRRIAFPREAFAGIVYNAGRPIFADARTRRALDLLVDREAVRCSSMRCLAEIVSDPWPRSLSRPAPSAVGRFDPAGARRLLDAAGWRDADGDGVRERKGVKLSFRLLIPDTDREAVSWMALFESDLSSAGAEASIASVGWGVYTDRLRAHRFDAAVVTTSNERPFDPRALFHSESASSARNFGSFESARMDAALDALARAATGAEREAARIEIDRALEEERPMSFAFRPGASMLVRDTVRGVSIRDDWPNARHLWLGAPRDGVSP